MIQKTNDTKDKNNKNLCNYLYKFLFSSYLVLI
jgi:hypothetical protein